MKAPQRNGSANSGSPSKSSFSFISVLTHLAVGIVAYQLGILTHFSGQEEQGIKHLFMNSNEGCNCVCDKDAADTTDRSLEIQSHEGVPIPGVTEFASLSPPISHMFGGAARVSRNNFTAEYDLGVPWDETRQGAEDVLLLYTSHHAFPTSDATKTISGKGWPNIRFESAKDATEQCDVMKVVLVSSNQKTECLAIVPQWESYHVHKYMRWKEDRHLLNRKVPIVSKDYSLKQVSRHHSEKGDRDARAPTMRQTQRYVQMLSDYLQKLEPTLERLRLILDEMMQRLPVTNHRRNRRQPKAVVVMVCNYGQSELFLNFICSAKSRGLDISRILLFATDKDMYDLAKSIEGISVFEVGDAFGDIPKDAAKVYGDKSFTGMMFSKIYCVQLVNFLGYDVLFQDVDIVWYKNPIDFFANSDKSGLYDFYFQDDGARSNRYAPYSPNSGFYYVRYNSRTLYFFSVFMRMGDAVIVSASHQAAMNGLLADQASSKGLRIKTFGKDSRIGLEFPGGYHFHYRRNFVKDMVQGKTHPFLFHMSWTKNKDNKVKFFQQMGDWYVQEECISKPVSEIAGSSSDFVGTCCSAEPLFSCHYSDKPSKQPCKSSPKIDKWGRAFW